MKGLAMTKSKKHSPIQSESDSILSQVPEDKMEAFADGLAELMEKRQSKPAGNSRSTSGILNQDDPNLILDGKIFPQD
jgi:hypothetical protein